MSTFFGQVRNLVLPPASQQMLWQYSTYDMADGQQEISLAYQQNRGDGLIPQSIIVDSTKIVGSCQIIWDVGGLNFSLDIPANIKSSFTVPAVEGVKYAIIPASGTVGTLRIDLLNFPDIPANFIAQDTATGQDVNITNASVPVANAEGTSLAATLQESDASIGSVGLNAGTNVIGTANVQNVSGSALATNATAYQGTTAVSASNPLTVSNVLQTGNLVSGSISGTATTVSLTPPASSNLRKLRLSISANSTLATAGLESIAVTLNGVDVLAESVYIPATALDSGGFLAVIQETFDGASFNAGTSGTLDVTIGSELVTGQLSINAIFD